MKPKLLIITLSGILLIIAGCNNQSNNFSHNLEEKCKKESTVSGVTNKNIFNTCFNFGWKSSFEKAENIELCSNFIKTETECQLTNTGIYNSQADEGNCKEHAYDKIRSHIRGNIIKGNNSILISTCVNTILPICEEIALYGDNSIPIVAEKKRSCRELFLKNDWTIRELQDNMITVLQTQKGECLANVPDSCPNNKRCINYSCIGSDNPLYLVTP